MKAFLIGKSYKPQVDPVSNVEAIGVNNKIYLAYKDPDDESRIYTKVVYNEEHFPANVNDGKIVLNSIVKDEYNVDPLIIEVPENKKYYVTIFVETYAQGVNSRYNVEVNVQKVERLINNLTVEAQGGIVSSEWWGSFTLPEPYSIIIRNKQIPIIKHWQQIKLKYRNYSDDLPLPTETDLNAYNAENDIGAMFNPLDNGIYNADINDSLTYYKQKENFFQSITVAPSSTTNRGFRIWFLDEDGGISGVTNWVIPLKYRDSDIFVSNISYTAKDTSIDFTFTLPSNIDSNVASGGTMETTTVNGYRFSYKKSSATSWSYSTLTSALENQTVTASLTGLESNTSYDIKIQIAYKNGRRTTQRYATHSQIESITISTLKSFDWETATWEEVCDQLDYIKENNLDMNDFFSIGMEKEMDMLKIFGSSMGDEYPSINYVIVGIDCDDLFTITISAKELEVDIANGFLNYGTGELYSDTNIYGFYNLAMNKILNTQSNGSIVAYVKLAKKMAKNNNGEEMLAPSKAFPLSTFELGIANGNGTSQITYANNGIYPYFTNSTSRIKTIINNSSNELSQYITRSISNESISDYYYIGQNGEVFSGDRNTLRVYYNWNFALGPKEDIIYIGGKIQSNPVFKVSYNPMQKDKLYYMIWEKDDSSVDIATWQAQNVQLSTLWNSSLYFDITGYTMIVSNGQLNLSNNGVAEIFIIGSNNIPNYSVNKKYIMVLGLQIKENYIYWKEISLK